MLLVLLAFGASCVHANQAIKQTFTDPVLSPASSFNHLTVDRNSGLVYIGAVNKIYQLTPDLKISKSIVTGPVNDSTQCSVCPEKLKPTDNVNKVLVIDYAASRLITCGSIFHGACSVHRLDNFTHDVHNEVREPVVANDATASTVAFIAPGLSNPEALLDSQVLYVGVTFSNSSIPSKVPTVSIRSLKDVSLFQITNGTDIFDNPLIREHYPINYISGFSSEGFSYFITTQPREVGVDIYNSKLIRVCQNDDSYYSYTEIPIKCTGDDANNEYNLVQAAFVGKVGSILAANMGITERDDVLFAIFSRSKSTNTDKSSKTSALCVYSLKAVRQKFKQKMWACFNGLSSPGLDWTSSTQPCLKTEPSSIKEDFCGENINTLLDGNWMLPVMAMPAAEFTERLTSVVAAATGDTTLVFAGTADGHLKKIIIDSASNAFEYEDIVIDKGSPVNKDLFFDPESMHLYVMTERKVSRIRECNVHKSCSTCLGSNDSYCGWCSIQNKCTSRVKCQDAAEDPLFWISNNSGHCTTITRVTPSALQLTTVEKLDLFVENIPNENDEISCVFTALGRTIISNGTRKPDGLICTTPRTDTLPMIAAGQHYFVAKLSLRPKEASDFAATKITFFDCNTYSSCTQCVNSSFPCHWCLERNRCTHDFNEVCHNDEIISGVNTNAASYRKGPGFCPTLISTYYDSNEILVPSGISKPTRVKVSIIGQFIVQTRFICKFNIDGNIIYVTGQLLADTIYCDRFEFTYTSRAPSITASFDVIWGGTKAIDNPNNIHIQIYRCNEMADSCNTCLALPEKFKCGWCQDAGICGVIEQCGAPSVWSNKMKICPNSDSV